MENIEATIHLDIRLESDKRTPSRFPLKMLGIASYYSAVCRN